MEKLLFQKGIYTLSAKTDYDRFSSVLFPTLVYIPNRALDAFYTTRDFVFAIGRFRFTLRLLKQRFIKKTFDIHQNEKAYLEFLQEFNKNSHRNALNLSDLQFIIERDDILSSFCAINPPVNHYAKMLLAHYLEIEILKEEKQHLLTKKSGEVVRKKYQSIED